MKTRFRPAGERHGTPRSRAFRAAAFTIIELLVVIAIIAILAGLLIPVIGRARKLAQLTRTKNNMKTIQVACQIYMTVYIDIENTLPPDSPIGAEPDWGNLRGDALPTLIVKGYIDGRQRGYSSEALTASVAGISGYDSNFTIGVHSSGSLIAGDSSILDIIRDPDYDPVNPRYSGIPAGQKNWLGPFGPCRNTIWVSVEQDKGWRIKADVPIAIGCRGPDRTWQTNPRGVSPTGTGFVCDSNGEGGDLFIIMKEDGTWIPFPDGVLKD
jgi:prepilin-type N-terminal cleavage/methylation domain-containing protein